MAQGKGVLATIHELSVKLFCQQIMKSKCRLAGSNVKFCWVPPIWVLGDRNYCSSSVLGQIENSYYYSRDKCSHVLELYNL